ncbi:DUF1156 domain-containing protein [Halobaculum sp. MBLA0143]|uniref:DUF1156 domain-containing protein n=1 Tax=Halobaculum sp. MBLA0143 TaxID=3079933 RepID=UPI0035242F30
MRDVDRNDDRVELPIERGFPIERINEIVSRESRAKQWYRPIYTMHKWWARRPGSLFRAITLYSLVNEETTAGEVSVYEPGANQTLTAGGPHSREGLEELAGNVDMSDPESLWQLYPKDIRIDDETSVLDPFAGGGTSLVEASRFGVETVGHDLNPVAWFVTKKELEAGETSVDRLERAYERVREEVADEIKRYYRTPCPNGDSADSSADGETARAVQDGGAVATHDGRHDTQDDHTHDADVMYNFWVKEIDCTSCDHTVPLFKDYRVAAGRYENDDRYNVLCPDCGEISLVDDYDSECTCDCGNQWVPAEGNVSRGGYYNCPECGLKESITDAIAEQGKPDERLYAVEYYCETCEEAGHDRPVYKGFKSAGPADQRLVESAAQTWQTRTDLHEYVPDEEIPEGAITEASSISGNDVFQHGYEKWTDMFNERQLLSHALLLDSIDRLSDENLRDYLLLVFCDALMFNSTFTIYNKTATKIEGTFRLNSFVPQAEFVENNVWGAAAGRGTFSNTFEKVKNAVEYASAPTDRYVEDGETNETDPFAQPIGEDSEVFQGDMREITAEDEYDAVITDPPYYDNIIYSEVSDYFYVWQKILLEDDYPGFDREQTPRAESIVTNPHLDKTAEDFEHEIGQALSVIRRALKDDGVLAFTYHHSDSESWGELLTSLCETGFEVTATYPINSDLNKFIGGDAVSFDIVIVARPTEDRRATSWNTLRREIVKTARETRETLESNRDLSRGDVGVIEMGECFQAYSKHHGKVHRAGEIMDAKAVVDRIYGIVQDADLGEVDIYLDLLEQRNPTTDDLNKLLRRADATRDQMEEMHLLDTDANGLRLYDWSDEKRQAYVREAVESPDRDATTLDRAHFLRERYEAGKNREEYLNAWDTTDLEELCEGLAEATDDETYLRMVGADTRLETFGGT